MTGTPAFWKRMGRNSAGQEIVPLPGRKWRGWRWCCVLGPRMHANSCVRGAHAYLLLQTAEVLRARSPCSSSLTGNLLEMHVLRPSCTFGAETLEAGVSSLF